MSVDMGSHGYQRKIEINAAIKECDNTLISRLALLVVLIDVTSAIDCIEENLVISGNKPFLIDGETLLHESGTRPALKHEIDESLVMSGLFEGTLQK